MIGTSLAARIRRQASVARELRQHQVEDDQVESRESAASTAASPSVCDLDLEPVALERVAEAADERRLVVDDQDAWAH